MSSPHSGKKAALSRVAAHPFSWFILAAVAWTLFKSRDYWPNNFSIFRTASFNLLAGRDLYVAYPSQHFDLFKYSPSFALLFVPFAVVPISPALLIWNVGCTALFLWGISMVVPSRAQQLIAVALLFLPYMSQLGGTQTNGLVAALMLIGAIQMERSRAEAAGGCVATGAAVKLFPVVLAPLAVMYPRKARFAVTAILAGILLAVAPAIILGPRGLLEQYQSWMRIESVDSLDRGYSVMGIMHDWLGYSGPNWLVQLAGAIVLLLPLALRKERRSETGFRRRMLASVFIYVGLFNHQAEYQSYLLPAIGLVIWFLWSRRSHVALFVTALGMIALHPLPYLLIWLFLQDELLRKSAPDGHQLDVAAAETLAHG